PERVLRSPLFWTSRAVAFHLLMLLVVTVCLALGYWQLRRGEAGNIRSYAYAVEWPFFAAAAGYMWWRTMRDDISGVSTADPAAVPGDETSQLPGLAGSGNLDLSRYPDPEPDPELDAYNAYLADLNADLNHTVTRHQ
ncbi:MAG: hypothetical protein ACRDPW_10485, partial [Mycobacteriales bacterium]